MPIKGLTDDKGAGAGLPLLGRLYKGGEKPAEGNKPGADLDYFRVEFEPQYEALLRPHWNTLYGEQPQEFDNVLLFSDTLEAVFSSWKEEWGKGGIIHRCDGETQTKHWTDAGWSSEPVACAAKCGCKEIGRLMFMLPDISRESGLFGYFLLTTHSVIDIIKISQYLRDIQRVYGHLAGVPLVLGRRPQKLQRAIDGKRTTITKSLIYIHVHADFVRHVIMPMLTSGERLALPSPGESGSSAMALPDGTYSEAEIMDEDEGQAAESGWNYNAVCQATKHLFSAPQHQENAIQKMLDEDILTYEMDDATAIAIITERQTKRNETRRKPGHDWKNQKHVTEFVGYVIGKYPTVFSNGKQVAQALGITGFSQLTMTLEDAWDAIDKYAMVNKPF